MRVWFALLTVLGLAWGAEARQALPSSPTAFVTDRAGVLSPSKVSELNAQLDAFEQQTSSQLVVWIDRKLPPQAELNDFVHQLFEAWKIGQKNRNNGVLLAIFVDDRRMRIEVGYGLEGALPDAMAGRIIDNDIRPRFRAGDFDGGVTAGVSAIMAATRGEYRGMGRTNSNRGVHKRIELWLLLGGVLGFLAGALVRGFTFRNSSGFAIVGESILGGFFGGVGHAMAAALFASPVWGLGFLPLLVSWVMILTRRRGEEWSRRGRRRYLGTPGNGWNWGGWSSGGGNSGGWSGFGGGGFSGGGGHSGGGGASGGW